MKTVYLIGYPGSGKSTLAKRLSRELNGESADLDQLIERDFGMSIPEIFDRHGEGEFRAGEARLLREQASQYSVLAVGGGTPVHCDNIDFMNRTGVTVYLELKTDDLIARIVNSDNDRPLFSRVSKQELPEFIRAHFNERKVFYERAHIRFSAYNLKSKSLDSLRSELKQHGVLL